MIDKPSSRPDGDERSQVSGSTESPDDGPPSAPGGLPILEQAFDGDTLYALRATVAAHAADMGLPHGRVDDLVIAVHELAANAVRHGRGHGRLRVWRQGQMLYCEVSDDGRTAATDVRRQPATQEPRPAGLAPWQIQPGHGLWVVRQIADRTSIRSGDSGTSAIISFSLGPAGPSPPFHLAQHPQRGCVIIAATGQLDLNSGEQLLTSVSNLLRAESAQRLILDLTGISLWDSAGLAALITSQQRVSGHPPALMVLAGLPRQLYHRLRDAGYADSFIFADSTDLAIRELSPPG
jgi:anti-anti-sigma factor